MVGNTFSQVLYITEKQPYLDWGLKTRINNDVIHSIDAGDDLFYIVAYTPEEFNRPSYGEYRIERNLCLFLVKFDNNGNILKYEIVSPILQTDFIQYQNGIVSYECYVAHKDCEVFFDGYANSGDMKRLPNGDIEIRLVNVKTDKEDLSKHDHNMIPYHMKYILTQTKLRFNKKDNKKIPRIYPWD